MTDKNQEIINALENVKFSEIEKELNNTIKKYGLTIPYDFERNLDSIKKTFIQDEVKKANTHKIEKPYFDESILRNIDSLQEIKDIIKTHFSKLNNDDKIKECLNNLHLKSLVVRKEDFKKYGLYGFDTENKHYSIRVYEFNKKSNLLNFSLSSFERRNYTPYEYTNYHNHNYIRALKFIVKEFLGIEWDNIDDCIKTTMQDDDFNKWDSIKGMKFKIFKNGKLSIKHKKAIEIFRAYKKYATSNYVFIEK